MRELFTNPPSEYRPTPFWFWNHKLDRDEVERQIREMHDKGVGGFFIHGRFGLETDYLSPEWMDLVAHAVTIAKSLKMHVWLYDENPFPSGVGGGIIMRNRDYWCKFLDLVRHGVNGEDRIELDIPEGDVVAASAIDLDNRTISINLGQYIEDRRLIWQAPAGNWQVMVFLERLAENPAFIYGSEPDYFEPGMVQDWLEITHESYARRVGEYFGKGIEGIFTDEPKMQCIYHMHDDPYTTAWFRGLPDLFRERYGYDLLPNLPALFTEFGPDPGKARRDFWRLVGEEYRQRLFKPYHEWCSRNKLKMTGHLFLEEGLYANTMYQADFMEDMRWFDVPGTDHLGLAAETEYGIHVIPKSITRTHGQKIASSSAHIYGKERTLSETFGCAGWDLSMAHMKWIADWQFSLGVNFLCPHAFYYSLAGVRKTDAPPSQFYQAAWWKHYKRFADYVGRMSLVLTQGKHHAQIAMLYPIHSFHSEWAVGTQSPLDTFIAECYDWYCKNLMAQHFDYDLVTEQAVRDAGISNGKLTIADEEYDLLLLPPLTAVELPTLRKIQKFVHSGGKVLATGLLPTADASPDGKGSPVCEETIDIVHGLFDEEPVTLRRDFLQTYDKEEKPTFRLTSEGRAGLIRCNRARLIGSVLRESVEFLITPDIRITSEGSACESINVLHRSGDAGEIYFFAHSGRDPVEVEISLAAQGFPECWDLETGDVRRIGEYESREGRTILPWRLEGFGSLLLVLSPKEKDLDPVPARVTSDVPPAELADKWRFRTEQPNVLVLDDWQLGIEASQDWTTYGYEATVESRFMPEEALLVLDDLRPGEHTQGTRIEVEVNGAKLETHKAAGWTVDVNFHTLDISGLLRKGSNRVVVKIIHGGWAGPPKLMTAPQYLMGAFSLERKGDDFVLAHPRTEMTTGSWTDQGYPFFSGTGVYSQTVRMPKEYEGKRLLLEVENPADMIEVRVNGSPAGVRPWPPFSVDVSEHIRPDENEIEVLVTNSLANMLRAKPRPSGMMGRARISCRPSGRF